MDSRKPGLYLMKNDALVSTRSKDRRSSLVACSSLLTKVGN